MASSSDRPTHAYSAGVKTAVGTNVGSTGGGTASCHGAGVGLEGGARRDGSTSMPSPPKSKPSRENAVADAGSSVARDAPYFHPAWLSRRATRTPCWMATGVSSLDPWRTSPTANTPGQVLDSGTWLDISQSLCPGHAWPPVTLPPAVSTPAFCAPKRLGLSGWRPMANITVSNSPRLTSSPVSALRARTILGLPACDASDVMADRLSPVRNCTPLAVRSWTTAREASESNARKNLSDRWTTVTGRPSPRKKPAHSSAM
mmetsp:Transcript_5351/g.22666  ORF Transcript_5351/g.22666 Transcript_5351/m.22666 type:complete len:259 (-) Transcript_5351:481-1257(-)